MPIRIGTKGIDGMGAQKLPSLYFLSFILAAVNLCFGQGLPMERAETLGFSSERLQRITPVMNDGVEKGMFPGMIVSVAKEGKIVFFERYGYKDVEKKEPLQADSIFRIYSMSKAITGVGVMMLFEEGRFLLDDPVSKYISAFKRTPVLDPQSKDVIQVEKPAREMTIRDLMRHTSGLGYGWGSDLVSQKYKALNLFNPDHTLEQMTDDLARIPLFFQPGSQWQYSVSIDVLGRLIEVVSGQSLEYFFNKRIFEPLKMTDTGFYVPPEKMNRFTNLYIYTKEKGLTPSSQEEAYNRYSREKNKLFSGGGGLVSTASDYMRFAQMLVNGGELEGARILSPKTVELMGMNHLPDGMTLPWPKLQGHGYGLSVSVLTDLSKSPTTGSVGDFGWDGAASTYFRVDPKERLAIVLMTQRMPTDDEIQIKLKTLVYQAMAPGSN